MSFWKKTMDYLGLGPDDAYDDYDDQAEGEASGNRSRSSRDADAKGGRSGSGKSWPTDSEETAIRAVPPARPSFPSRDFESPNRRTSQPDDSGSVSRPQPRPASRPPAQPSNTEPVTVRPRSFNQAQELADKFKENQSVILNLEATERDVARRLIDFASGVCYSLDGSMEKVATGVYLLKPAPQRVHRFDDYES
jgi:cell division inhibitor SepF